MHGKYLLCSVHGKKMDAALAVVLQEEETEEGAARSEEEVVVLPLVQGKFPTCVRPKHETPHQVQHGRATSPPMLVVVGHLLRKQCCHNYELIWE